MLLTLFLDSPFRRRGEELNARCRLYNRNDTAWLTLNKRSVLHLERKELLVVADRL